MDGLTSVQVIVSTDECGGVERQSDWLPCPPRTPVDVPLVLSSVSELAMRLSGYRPSFRLPIYHPLSVGSRDWKPYTTIWEWSPEQVTDMFTEIRQVVQTSYKSPQQLTGFETFRWTQVMFGHFAASYIIFRDQVRFQPTAKRPYPPAPKQLQQIFQLLIRDSSKSSVQEKRHKTGVPLFRAHHRRVRGQHRKTIRIDANETVAAASAASAALLTSASTFASDASTTAAAAVSGPVSVRAPSSSSSIVGCLQNCSEQDIRCNKYILHHGLGVHLWTILPNGQSVASFATQYVYNDHMRRMVRKRTRRLNLEQHTAQSAQGEEEANDVLEE